jgi:hypothetical protein
MVQMKFVLGNGGMSLDDELNKSTIGYASLGTKSKSIWTHHDDGVLLKAVARQCGGADILDDRIYEDETVVDWDDIAHGIPGKSAVQCLKRYIKIRKQLPYVSPRNNNKIQAKSAGVVQNLSFETIYDEDIFENPSRKKQKIFYTDRDHWCAKDSSLLIKLVEVYQGIAPRWNEIAANFTDRSALDCITQWQHLTKSTVKKGKGSWTAEEDAVLKEKRLLYGRKWSQIATHLPGRQGKQCRERYMNNLDPNLLKGEWTEEEDLVLIAMQEIHGNKWASISKYLPGRSDNDIKKHWHFAIQQKFMVHGKDVSKTSKCLNAVFQLCVNGLITFLPLIDSYPCCKTTFGENGSQ